MRAHGCAHVHLRMSAWGVYACSRVRARAYELVCVGQMDETRVRYIAGTQGGVSGGAF
jgi:hypothetical protein